MINRLTESELNDRIKYGRKPLRAVDTDAPDTHTFEATQIPEGWDEPVPERPIDRVQEAYDIEYPDVEHSWLRWVWVIAVVATIVVSCIVQPKQPERIERPTAPVKTRVMA